jgi:hypothetical protein
MSSPTTIFLSGWARLKQSPTAWSPDVISRTGASVLSPPPSSHGT